MKYYIWTEGCQMNVADSARLARALSQLQYTEANKAEEADLIVLNTCVVRQSAEDKALGRLNSIKPLKSSNPKLVIALMGCLIGVQGNPAMQKRFPWVDVFSAPSDPEPILNFLEKQQDQTLASSWREDVDTILDEEFGLSANASGRQISENLPIVLGCSHACAYCVIPARRGREVSRDARKILNEARTMVAEGVREIVLLGQIVDRYGLDKAGSPLLPELMEEIAAIQGLLRLRFLTSHPDWMSDDLIDTVARVPKIMPHIEVPIQAGDDQILMDMRRGYTQAQYRELVAKLRQRIPGVSIATDIIVGFPGESETSFMRTYTLLDELKLDVAHLARYSTRPNTYSQRFLEDDVPAEEKMRRFRVLETLQEGITAGLNQAYLGQEVSVLFESKAKNRWRGRTHTNRLVFVESERDLRGFELLVKINWTGPWTLLGELA